VCHRYHAVGVTNDGIVEGINTELSQDFSVARGMNMQDAVKYRI